MKVDLLYSTPEELIEQAARVSHESAPRPGEPTGRLILRLLEWGHFSPLEHSLAVFEISGISRACSHQLVRHRHLSFTQRSQRYVDEDKARVIIPEDVPQEVQDALWGSLVKIGEEYRHMKEFLTKAGIKESRAREIARLLLPNATETHLIVSGNYRAWRHFLSLRGHPAAEREIRALAVEIFHLLQQAAPHVFQDFSEVEQADASRGLTCRHPESN